jgi:uncharacterized membrane protein YfcA
MNISSYGHKFFIFAGVLLIAVAAVQLLTQRRDRRAAGAFRLDARTVQSLVFLVIGVLVVLAGAGVFPLPGDK